MGRRTGPYVRWLSKQPAIVNAAIIADAFPAVSPLDVLRLDRDERLILIAAQLALDAAKTKVANRHHTT